VPGSQHPIYTVENSPYMLVEKKCLDAGLTMQGQGRVRKGNVTITIFKGWGPMAAFRFLQVDRYKKLGMGSGALKAPIKGQDYSDVLTFGIPPITVTHRESPDAWTATIDHYLAVYNSSDLCTLPVNSNTIYDEDPTEVFKQTAQMIMGEMSVVQMPLSKALKRRLPREYCSGDSLSEEMSEEESSSDDSMEKAEEESHVA
jgi:hypothetical protein